jgi:hypothetical protein
MDKYLFFNNQGVSSTGFISGNTTTGVFPLSRLKSVHPNGSDKVRLSFEPSQNQFFDGSSTTDTAIGDVDFVDLTIPSDILRNLTGSIDVTGANTNVPGTGTLFLTELEVGDEIQVSSEVRTIATITDNTTATVTAAWSSNLANDTSPVAYRTQDVAFQTMTATIRDLFKKIQAAPAGSLITIYDARKTTENIINVTAVTITRQSANNAA